MVNVPSSRSDSAFVERCVHWHVFPSAVAVNVVRPRIVQQEPGATTCAHDSSSPHASTVQTLASTHAPSGFDTQVPAEHVPAGTHAAASRHDGAMTPLPRYSLHEPSRGSQRGQSWHSSEPSHGDAPSPRHTPSGRCDTAVQASRSSHAVPSAASRQERSPAWKRMAPPIRWLALPHSCSKSAANDTTSPAGPYTASRTSNDPAPSHGDTPPITSSPGSAPGKPTCAEGVAPGRRAAHQPPPVGGSFGNRVARGRPRRCRPARAGRTADRRAVPPGRGSARRRSPDPSGSRRATSSGRPIRPQVPAIGTCRQPRCGSQTSSVQVSSS